MLAWRSEVLTHLRLPDLSVGNSSMLIWTSGLQSDHRQHRIADCHQNLPQKSCWSHIWHYTHQGLLYRYASVVLGEILNVRLKQAFISNTEQHPTFPTKGPSRQLPRHWERIPQYILHCVPPTRPTLNNPFGDGEKVRFQQKATVGHTK